MHSKRLAVATLVALSLTACGSSEADDRADACKQAYEQHLDIEGIKGFVVTDDTAASSGVHTVAAYVDAKNGLGDPIRIDVTCQMDPSGKKVTVETDPAF